MPEEDFARVQRDNEIIYNALNAMADRDDYPADTRRANELAARFRPTTFKKFRRASRYLAREALNDAQSSTNVPHEMELLAMRALERDAEAVEDLASRKSQ